ncbi:MAG: hypothetical protein WDN30_05395 [Pararobbsia sp.]
MAGKVAGSAVKAGIALFEDLAKKSGASHSPKPSAPRQSSADPKLAALGSFSAARGEGAGASVKAHPPKIPPKPANLKQDLHSRAAPDSSKPTSQFGHIAQTFSNALGKVGSAAPGVANFAGQNMAGHFLNAAGHVSEYAEAASLAGAQQHSLNMQHAMAINNQRMTMEAAKIQQETLAVQTLATMATNGASNIKEILTQR